MKKQAASVESTNRAHRSVTQLGFWASILTTGVTAVAFALAITTLPISGPFCQRDCVTYPYANVAAYVPRDYI